MRRLAIPCSLSLVLAACAASDSGRGSVAALDTVLSTPTLSVVAVTQTTITVRVCAGDSGAPAGFSLQWETQAEWAASGWSEDVASYCAASYSGNANASPYALDAGQCVDVVVDGQTFSDGHGGSSECTSGLACGTTYVFRAFAHAVPHTMRSEFSDPPLVATTAACEGGCVLTQGYWKNHSGAWPVATLTLGERTYDQAELLAILGQPVHGNGLVSLSHQLIAAKLNVAAGAASVDAIAEADALIGALVVPPVGDGALAPADTSALNDALDAFNSGAAGVPHCGDGNDHAGGRDAGTGDGDDDVETDGE